MDSGSTGPTSEFQSLLSRLAEGEDMLRAVRAGEVDAIVVDGNDAPAVYT
jgi:ABC-type amino acid transport substrate-binding protein